MNLVILVNPVILDAVWMRSGCGLDAVWMRSGCGLNILYILASMLKIYIYWHKCSCYYAGRTNEQLKIELLNWKAVFRNLDNFTLNLRHFCP